MKNVLFPFLCFFFAVNGLTILQWHVVEESQPGTLVGNLGKYTDKFRNYDLSTSSKNFVYNKTSGNLNTLRVIDRDKLPEICINGSVVLETIMFITRKNSRNAIYVQVYIDDINDNSPKFPSDFYNKVVSEEVPVGYFVEIPVAIDNDCGENGRLQYSALNHSKFRVQFTPNEDFIHVVVIAKLDRETQQFHVVHIRTCDSNPIPKCSRTILNITVSDFNDNKPIFNNLISEVNVEEGCHSNGNFVLALNVSDKDSGVNSEVALSISDASKYHQMFTITKDHQLLSTHCLVFDKKEPSFTIVINAVDHGVPQQQNSFSLRINVVDINDHSPDLLVIWSRNVIENQPSSSYIGLIEAIDNDDGDNAKVELNITNGNPKNQFYLVKISELFSLNVRGVLDREEIDTYNMTIKGFDHGSHQKSSFINIIIKVLDENDNQPICSFETPTVVLNESSPVGTFVAKVNGVDFDEGRNGLINYSLTVTQGSFMFYIHYKSGMIILKSPLDYESLDWLHYV
ncbi:cadherin-related tumor suppressor-like [Xenia sp. Carnegie-2017]|uniref:cadherin-related tumor suppressor-like n=1 Tax=Xenia sp. Carnegie-2017 TaxID=2897299 RepID=UPI001F04A567|nr:cadherin-related tumor suppressor-like [Xenia sp. Carnegie-2017]